MSSRKLKQLLLVAGLLSLAISGCSFGGSDSASAAEHVDGGPTPVALASPTPSAPTDGISSSTPTSTPTPSDSPDGTSSTAVNQPEPIAYVDALVSPAADATSFDVTVLLDVSERGVSGVDLVANAISDSIVVRSVEVAPLVGDDALVAIASIAEDGSARVAFARAGASKRTDVAGVVATLSVDAPSLDAIRTGLALSLTFTDASLAHHGPFDAAFDLGDET